MVYGVFFHLGKVCMPGVVAVFVLLSNGLGSNGECGQDRLHKLPIGHVLGDPVWTWVITVSHGGVLI